jgi:integrase/recombinase XerD
MTIKEFEDKVKAFLDFKRALGRKYKSGEETLRSFESFAVGRIGARSQIDLQTTIHAWLESQSACKPVTLALRLGVLRQLCLYLRRSDPTAFLPPVSLAPKTKSQHVPYAFSHEQILQLIDSAAIDPPRKVGPRRDLWPEALRMLLIATYCTGLRLGEAVRLQTCDLDNARRVLRIRESKGRSRDLPFRADLALEFTSYLEKRTEMLRTFSCEHETALFINRRGHPVTVPSTSIAIRRLLRRLGMKSQHGRSGPRPYDLRHAFAVHRLTAWYREGADLQARLPWLSAYMGHLNLLGTEVYLHATPELLNFAAKRFAHLFETSGDSQ